jgi:hypothetical protein
MNRIGRFFVIFAVLAALWGVPRPSYACMLLPLSLDQLIEQSDLIVEGTVAGTFERGHGAQVNVSTVYKGEATTPMTVNPSLDPPQQVLDADQGLVTDINSCDDSQATFTQGESVLLFLQRDAERGLIPVGMMMGKVTRLGEMVNAFFLNNAPGGQVDPTLPHTWDALQARITEATGQAPAPATPAPQAQPERSNLPLTVGLLGSAALLGVAALLWRRSTPSGG